MSKETQEEIHERILKLNQEISALRNEVKRLQGLLKNRAPAVLEKAKSENAGLKTRMQLLEKALFGILVDSEKPRVAEEERLQYEVLRQTTLELCQKADINPEVWKSLVS